jgi:hypothetical protein
MAVTTKVQPARIESADIRISTPDQVNCEIVLKRHALQFAKAAQDSQDLLGPNVCKRRLISTPGNWR